MPKIDPHHLREALKKLGYHVEWGWNNEFTVSQCKNDEDPLASYWAKSTIRGDSVVKICIYDKQLEKTLISLLGLPYFDILSNRIPVNLGIDDLRIHGQVYGRDRGGKRRKWVNNLGRRVRALASYCEQPDDDDPYYSEMFRPCETLGRDRAAHGFVDLSIREPTDRYGFSTLRSFCELVFERVNSAQFADVDDRDFTMSTVELSVEERSDGPWTEYGALSLLVKGGNAEITIVYSTIPQSVAVHAHVWSIQPGWNFVINDCGVVTVCDRLPPYILRIT